MTAPPADGATPGHGRPRWRAVPGWPLPPGDSIRTRLAMWHTLTLATLLGAFAAGTWIFLARTTMARADASLADMTRAFVEVWDGERVEHGSTATEAAADAAAEFRYRERRVLVFDHWARLVALSDSAPLAPALDPRTLADLRGGPAAALVRDVTPGHATFATLDGGVDDEVPVRAHALRVAFGGEPFTVLVLRSMRAEEEAAEAFVVAFGITIPLLLVLAGVGGYLLARASLTPVVTMARQAERISASNLDERLPVANPRDELGGLATVLNGLLGRLEQAFERQQRAADQQRQFMADASHELRTPVAALCSVADVALSRGDRDASELVEALDVMRGEGRRLGRVVDDLFLLARADAGQLPIRPEPLFLEELIQDCARAARGMAARRQITLDVPPADEAPFVGDPHLLGRLVLILLDNAIKYTPPGGRVRLQLTRADDGGSGGLYAVAVEDTGPGVPPDAGERIFERFVRVDAARTRSTPAAPSMAELGLRENGPEARPTDAITTGGAHQEFAGGAGLGLAIARWIATAHRGTVRLDATGPSGSRFVATFPVPSGDVAEPAETSVLGDVPES